MNTKATAGLFALEGLVRHGQGELAALVVPWTAGAGLAERAGVWMGLDRGSVRRHRTWAGARLAALAHPQARSTLPQWWWSSAIHCCHHPRTAWSALLRSASSALGRRRGLAAAAAPPCACAVKHQE